MRLPGRPVPVDDVGAGIVAFTRAQLVLGLAPFLRPHATRLHVEELPVVMAVPVTASPPFEAAPGDGQVLGLHHSRRPGEKCAALGRRRRRLCLQGKRRQAG